VRLLAISDLHLSYAANRRGLASLPDHPEDWLILAGDTGENTEHLDLALRELVPRFRQVIWAPGNHDLWTRPDANGSSRGEARYAELVAMCRARGVITPEDPYPEWPGGGRPRIIAPLFLLYDYSFRPDDVLQDQAVAWAKAAGTLCADEHFLFPDPYPSCIEWCAARCATTATRLSAIPAQATTILVNHFPLRRDLADLPLIPRFSIWCGTRLTEDWHLRFRAEVVVHGHLHRRSTRYRDRVRFEEVSLGYPRQWQAERPIEDYLRLVL
jgi:3',5'-cyclic AMP phosphodiesterase CpdA